jgi:hypothetical protein
VVHDCAGIVMLGDRRWVDCMVNSDEVLQE